MLFGSSVGSLNGAMLHQDDLDQMGPLWMNIKTSDVYNSNPITWGGVFDSRASIFDTEPLFKLIKKNISHTKLTSNPKPFYINATEFYPEWYGLSFECKTLTERQLPVYIRGGASPPIGFPSVKMGDEYLYDAGIVNNFSIRNAVDLGADTVIVMTATVPEPLVPTNVIGALTNATSQPEYTYLDSEISFVHTINTIMSQCTCPNPGFRQIKVILIRPPKPTGINLLDFDYVGKDRKSLIDYGYNLARDILVKEVYQT